MPQLNSDRIEGVVKPVRVCPDCGGVNAPRAERCTACEAALDRLPAVHLNHPERVRTPTFKTISGARTRRLVSRVPRSRLARTGMALAAAGLIGFVLARRMPTTVRTHDFYVGPQLVRGHEVTDPGHATRRRHRTFASATLVLIGAVLIVIG